MKKLCVFLTSLLFVGVQLLQAQNVRITGTVTSSEDGMPLPGVSVVVKGATSIGVATNVDGKYELNAPASATTLEFSFIGFETQVVEIAGRSVIDVTLATASEQIEEVMVVAYGTAKKESFTGSAAVVKSENLTKRSVSNVSKAIEGLVAGVVSTSGGGQPGDGASLHIRGYGSINASSSPLYVVDGIPFDGSISSINPNDIEGMTILKDASAGALYGARGANGVVIITTKKGEEGKMNVNVKAQVGWQSRSLKEYEMVSQNEFVELTFEALKNAYMFNSGYGRDEAFAAAAADLSSSLGGEFYNPYTNYTWEQIIDPTTLKVRSDAQSAWNESWMKELTNESAMRQEYQIGLNGGNKNTKYTASFGYMKDEGVLITTNFSRFSGRTGVDHKINKWASMGVNTSYSYTQSNSSQYSDTQTGNAWYTAQFMAPIYPVYLKGADKKDALDANGKKQYDYGEGGRPKASKFNAVGDLYDNKYETLLDNVGYRTFLKLGGDDEAMGMLKGLALTLNFGGDVIDRNISSYYNPFHGDGSSTGGSLSKYSTRTFSYTFNQLLTYNRSVGDHTFDILLGHEFYNYDYKYLYGARTGLYPGIAELAPAVNVTSNNSYSEQYRIESYLSRLTYDFADKYYISASWRKDGSSRFYKDNRWGQFWSLGASWRISEESFMESLDWLDNATIKASYGTQGNDDLSTFYAWQSFYNLTWANANNAGAIVSSLMNKNVTWEKKNTLNIGLESSFLDRLINFSFEYYISKTNDMLLSAPMPMSTGFTGYNANVGSMENKGIEANIRVNWLKQDQMKANSNIMLFANRNKVTHLTEDDVITSGIRVIEVGRPIYTYYMTKSAGVNPVNGELLYWAYEKDADGNMIKGSEYITNDKTAANDSKYYFDSREPVLQGSFGTDFQYGPVDFSFLTTFSIGGNVYESVYASAMEVSYTGDTWSKHALRRWQNPGDVTDVPAIMTNSSRLSTDRFLIDASYFSIKSIQLGYTLPEAWATKAGFKSVRVFGVCDNIAMFTRLQGMDPQYNFTGGSNWSYAPTRTISVGLDLNF